MRIQFSIPLAVACMWVFGAAIAPGQEIRISGQQYVEWAKDGTGLTSYANSGYLCVVHRPDCGSVGHNGKEHFFSSKNPLPAGVTIKEVDYMAYWPIGLTKTDRGGLGSEGSYGVDLEDPGSKTPPISVHWQNACQSSTSNNWSKLPATYQISFVLAGPQSALDEVSRKNASVAPSVNPGPVCNRSDTPGPLPGQCAIESLTATWNGHTVGAGNTLVIPVGSKATVAWTTANCGAGAAIGLEAINGTGAAEIWTKNNLAAQGSIPVAPTDDVTTYLMGASDTKSRSMNDIESAKVLIQLTTTGAATCSGCQWYYFQLNSPAGSNPECITYAAYGTLAQAQAEAQAQATNYTVKQITAEQYYAGCSS